MGKDHKEKLTGNPRENNATIQPPQNESGFFYVPQGRCAHISPISLSYGINGLFTDEFSTCNVLICVGDKGASLYHVDFETFRHSHKLKEEVLWVGNNCRIFLLYKKSGERTSEYIKVTLFDFQITSYLVSDTVDGVALTLNQENKYGIKKFESHEKSMKLFFHPDEQKFTTVRIMEEVIGKKASRETKAETPRQHLIFDQNFMCVMPETEFLIDEDNLITRREMNDLRSTTSFFEILDKLSSICDSYSGKANNFSLEDLLHYLSRVAYSVENYLDSFRINPESSFRGNILAVCQDKRFGSEDDKQYQELFLNIFENTGIKIEKVFDYFPSFTAETKFQKNVVGFYQLFLKFYQRRLDSIVYVNKLNEKIQSLERKYEHAKNRLRNRSYDAATNLFRELEVEMTVVCLPNSQFYRKVVYNYGRSLLGVGSTQEAKAYLERALKISEEFFPSECVEKYMDIISSCDEKNENKECGSEGSSHVFS